MSTDPVRINSAEIARGLAKATRATRRLARSFEALGDAARIATSDLRAALGQEWKHPELVLTDEERDALEARQMGRTLADIDELPTTE